MRAVPCRDCGLHATRTNLVLYRGNPLARIMLLGEAPGQQEDLTGQPFVGQAGKLLDRMLAYINLNPEQDVYITNILRCRPPQNRNPLLEEMEACLPYLQAQIDLVQPEVFVILGKVAAVALGLLPDKAPLKEVLGQWLHYQNRPAIVLYHPAYLLRNPYDKLRQAELLEMVATHLHNHWLR